MNDLTRSIGRVGFLQRVPRLVRPWHTLGELGRSQFRVGNGEQRRLRGKMLTLEGRAKERCRDLDMCGGHV